jgi:hypothetical protein
VIAFLVDQNFNEHIVDGLTRRDASLDFTHVRAVGLAAAPDPTILDWLRQCRRARLYNQGQALFEKGGLHPDNLSPEEQIEADDNHRIRARRGSTAEAKPKKGRRKNQEPDE